MRELLRTTLLIAAVLLVPIVPFLFLGGWEDRMLGWINTPPASQWTVAWLVVGLLAVDIFLPVPSSAVCTFSGAHLGWLAGGLAAWLGMTAGSVVGFALARALGRPLAERFANPGDLDRSDQLGRRFGTAVLVMTRPLPVLAEAAVLLMGVSQLSWRRFLISVGLSNLGVALVYAVFGRMAFEQNALALALLASVALPVVATIFVRWWLPSVEGAKASAADSNS
ncbi:MAG: VTT domain-containing protein [Planctomycetales bacterium]|nr:VTT domain-containing protein [Planctomycetales bacterium]